MLARRRRRDHRRGAGARADIARRSPAARCSAAAPTCFPSSASCAAISRGSAWKEYRASGTLAGEPLPAGLRESDRFDPPLFTPGDQGRVRARREHHDRADAPTRSAPTSPRELERLSRLVYERGREHRRARAASSSPTRSSSSAAIATATITLIDEVLTPDSSRFWPADQLSRRAARSRASTSSRCATTSTPSGAPDAGTARRRRRRCRTRVVAATSARYLDAFRRLTGAPLDSDRRTLVVNFAREGLDLHRASRRSIAAGTFARGAQPALVAALAARLRAHRHRALGRVLLPRSGAHRRARRPAS